MAGEVVIHEGDPGGALFIVMQGTAEIFQAASPSRRRTTCVHRLRKGDLFGDESFFSGNPRSATVRACVELHLVRVLRRDWDELGLGMHKRFTLRRASFKRA